MVNSKMFCWIENVWPIQWIEFKAKIIEQKLGKSGKIYIVNNGYGDLAFVY